MNIKNEKNIWESLNKNETFYICQIKVIIQNQFAFNCCEFMTNPNECKYLSAAAILNSQTIPTTMISQTTEISPHVDIILVLFSGWNQVGNICSFYIYFTSRTTNYVYSTLLNVTIIFNYNRALRRLEEKKGICTLEKNGINSNAKYLCKVQSDNSNIKSAKILPNIVFNSPDNITLHMTPIAKMFLNNIQNIKDQFNYFSDVQIYILDHCIINRYQTKLLNVSGEIHDPQPTLKNMDIVLMINLDSEINSQAEINCIFTDIKFKNYSLNCRINEDMKGDFQTAISFIGDNILITYFDSYYESIIEEVQKKESIKYINNKKNKGFSWVIAVIILVSIVCIGALIAFFIIIRKKKVKQDNQEEATKNSFKLKK